MIDRYVPEIAFPVYAFVPGQHPHPVSDARGHSFGCPQAEVAALDPQNPMGCPEYLFAIDLFNAGYYWEAHEVWEGLWVGAGRNGTIADFLKGLIKLAAAGVKAREGSLSGVQRHAARAHQLFEIVRQSESVSSDQFAGLALPRLVQSAKVLNEQPVMDPTATVVGNPVLQIELELMDR